MRRRGGRQRNEARCRLKCFRKPGLLQDSVCCEFRLQLSINGYVDTIFSVPPDFMVPASLSFELVSVVFEYSDQITIIIRHWQRLLSRDQRITCARNDLNRSRPIGDSVLLEEVKYHSRQLRPKSF